ncbi:hypothetical protein PM082_022333 [Marasmius tenuissimus]|nr:hypothetical protein PM082_022333 [Marasmius tenuissimus]
MSDSYLHVGGSSAQFRQPFRVLTKQDFMKKKAKLSIFVHHGRLPLCFPFAGTIGYYTNVRPRRLRGIMNPRPRGDSRDDLTAYQMGTHESGRLSRDGGSG